MKTSLFGVCFALLFSLFSAHASEDPLRDTLWIRQMPLGGQNFSKPLFHPNGKTVFATSDQYMFEYDVATGELLKTRETKSQRHITDYVLTSDARYIIVCTLPELIAVGDCEIEVWHSDSGFVKEKKFSGYGYPKSLALSPDNTSLYVGFTPVGLYRINVEKMQIDKEENEYGFGDNIALSPDGKTLISTVEYFQAEDKSVSALLDSESFKVIGSVPDFITRPTFSSNGEYIVGGTYYQNKDYIALYNVRTGEYRRMGVNSTVLDAKFTKDNKYFIATTSSSGYLVYDIEQKKRLYTAPYEKGGNLIALSHDNKLYCAVNPAFHVRMWNFTNPIINNISDNSSSPLSIYPNPTQSLLTIQLPSIQQHGKGSCIISDILGNKVIEKEIMQTELAASSYSLNIAHLPNGRYNCHIVIGSSEYFAHFLINR